jgi:cellulose synthase/poly-beta-1,6-N-acetylglucosamine synthase-like glycosyltransferase
MLSIYLFWVCLILLFYTYVGYAIAVYVLAKLGRPRPSPQLQQTAELPGVTMVIAAYNEAAIIGRKIEDCLALDYPRERLSIYIVTDGSTDGTPKIAGSFSEVKVFHEVMRKGKIHAVNRVMKFVTTPVTVFCDANTFLNSQSIRLIVKHYQDPSVGGVAGEKRIFKKEADSASGSGEGLYWKYESFLKKKDAEISSVVGAAGELFSIRTELYEAPAEDIIIEDFYLSLRIVGRGFRFEYEPEAYAIETASASVHDEWKRKVRICAGAFQAIPKLLFLLNPFRYGLFSFQYFSHRILRWTLAPLSLLLLVVSNAILAWHGQMIYQLFFVLQASFYLLAFLGYLVRDKEVSIKGFFVPYYFVLMNASVFAGFLRHITGGQTVLWDKAERAELNVK